MNSKPIPQNAPSRPRNKAKRDRRIHRELKKKGAAALRTTTAQPEEKGGKVFHAGIVADMKRRIRRITQHISLPASVLTLRRGHIVSCLVVNRPAVPHELLPDRPAAYKVLCTAAVARIMTSHMCVFAKITQHERTADDGTRQWIDGSWTLAPCTPALLNGTTVQHVRRRRFWWLHRYHYEISFDGRVQPASLFYDYDIDPLTRRKRMWLTHEYVEVRNHPGRENDFIRFWRCRSNARHPAPPHL